MAKDGGTWDVEFEDDAPWADPQIQKDYEAALGAFLVSFNRLEDAVSKLIASGLTRLGRDDLLQTYATGLFKRRIQNLKLVLLAFPNAPKFPLSDIEKLAKSRNVLAHGHFEQNPFAGDYKITGFKPPEEWPPSKIKEQQSMADELYARLRSLEAFFEFDPVKIA